MFVSLSSHTWYSREIREADKKSHGSVLTSDSLSSSRESLDNTFEYCSGEWKQWETLEYFIEKEQNRMQVGCQQIKKSLTALIFKETINPIRTRGAHCAPPVTYLSITAQIHVRACWKNLTFPNYELKKRAICFLPHKVISFQREKINDDTSSAHL